MRRPSTFQLSGLNNRLALSPGIRLVGLGGREATNIGDVLRRPKPRRRQAASPGAGSAAASLAPQFYKSVA